ncbi:MAG: hypothetical protein NXH79_07795 [Rhodobacteraceae bacterium]|nr:hypothetical protein [Paracoccaceae bacterium]
MSGAFFAWLGAAMVIFLSASTALRAYVAGPRPVLLIGALVLYTLGNLIMVRLMRETGMAVAISISAVLQLVLAAGVGIALFGERPGLLQSAGLILGVVAVALIVWPTRPG